MKIIHEQLLGAWHKISSLSVRAAIVVVIIVLKINRLIFWGAHGPVWKTDMEM